MTTPTELSPSMPTPSRDRVPLRLQLAGTFGHGEADGAWWPQSRDLARELSDLVDNFPPEHGRVHRVVFSRPDWDTAPHRVRVARGIIKVGSYPGADTRQVWLSMSSHVLIRLSVTAHDGSAVQEVPAGATPPVAAVESESDPEYWTDDGGSWWHPHPVAPSHRT